MSVIEIRAPDMSDPPFGCPPDVVELTAAYYQLKSVWKVGKRFNMRGQTVHARLKKAGVDMSVPVEFTDEQKQRIRDYYNNTPFEAFNLNVLATELGKSKHNIARFARRNVLTDRKRPHNAETRAKQKEARRGWWTNRPHPRGMKGKKHTLEAVTTISARSKRYWATCKAFGIGYMSPENRARMSKQSSERMAKRPASSIYTRAKGGRRADLDGIYFRSSWEANYARYLNLLKKFGVIEHWAFEPETFWFEGVRRGVVSYKPDFKVQYKGDPILEYVEIKGWIVPKDRTKWRRMKKYHPHIKLIVIGAKQYYAIQKKWASSIPNWESARSAASGRLILRAVA